MDYGRVYREFIADRRARGPFLEGYTERHHILPRSLGGGNEPENLIRLTPEDHFFAHLLLAKIYGGRMWVPLRLMLKGHVKWMARVSRSAHGLAARVANEGTKGRNHYSFSAEQIELLHLDGRSWRGTRQEMTSQLGLSPSLASMLRSGRVNSARGWRILGATARGRTGPDHWRYNPEVKTFRHVDGSTFSGTGWELASAYGLHKPKCAALVRGKIRVTGGWFVDGLPPLPVGRCAKLSGRLQSPGEGNARLVVLEHVDGRTFSGSAAEAVRVLGLGSTAVSMVKNGKRAQTRGWRLAA